MRVGLDHSLPIPDGLPQWAVITSRDCRPRLVLAIQAKALSVGRRALGLYLLPALLAISACAHTPVAVCPPLKSYPPEFNERLASELEPLPGDSATIQAIQDYIALRDAVKACRGD